LTAAGTLFLADARAILGRVEEATHHARSAGAEPRSVRMGFVPSATHSLLPGLLQRLQAAPQLQVREMITSAQLRALRNDEIDIGIARPAAPLKSNAHVQMVACINDPYCLALPAGHPLAQTRDVIALKQLAHAEFVGFSRYQDAAYFDRIVALCMDAGFSPNIKHEVGEFVSVLGLVSLGLGVAIVPSSLTMLTLLARQSVVFRPLAASKHSSQLAILCSTAWRQQEGADAMLALATAELEDLERRIKS
jgi:DNA-binding transcriptional LysR family regulator